MLVTDCNGVSGVMKAWGTGVLPHSTSTVGIECRQKKVVGGMM